MNTSTMATDMPLLLRDVGDGALTRMRKRRALLGYLGLFVLGLLPLVASDSAAWQAAGVGLWFPGAGFLAAGGWWVLLVPVVVLLFVVSLIAWLGAGMLIAPIAVWLGSAALAGAAAGAEIWFLAPYLTVAAVALVVYLSRQQAQARRARQLELRGERNAYLPEAIAAVTARAAAAQPPRERELSDRQLASLRYCIDRGLQPLEDWSHFTKIDQFQPAAYRYQLNNLGYAIGLAQCFYTPNFHGYMSLAQRNIIEKYTRKENWDYWRLERLWGSFSLDFDPASEDNIMLTGFYGINLGLYQSNTGDDRYAQPGALEFRLNSNTLYPHDFHSITGSIVNNMKRGDFCLYPCEPNWIYTPCNFRGLTTIALHDRLCQGADLEDVLPGFMAKLDGEFATADGNILTVMSSHTGLALPLPFGNESRSHMMNVFAPEVARQAWAMARHDAVTEVDGKCEIVLKGKGVDFGNYKTGHVATLAGIACAAAEMGDREVWQAALDRLEQDYAPEIKDGVAWYPASNGTRAFIAQAQISQMDDWRNSVIRGPGATALEGPVLDDVSYPQVLVAKAVSTDGVDLQLVLHCREPSPQTLTFARLRPGQGYRISSPRGELAFSADQQGRGGVTLALEGRTELSVLPV